MCCDMEDKKNKSIVLYHGSPNKDCTPIYGGGDIKHDYGRGFYLTPDIELAKEWSVCTGNKTGYVHKYVLDLSDLHCFHFDKEHCLCWLAELMKHRDADSSARYRKFSKVFISKFGKDTSTFDLIKGWRADSSYFYIAKLFVRNEIDYDLLPELLKYGDLGIQYCLKSKKAFNNIKEVKDNNFPMKVGTEYYRMYNQRDSSARTNMKKLIDSSRNTMLKGFDYVIGGDFNDKI